MHSKEDEVEEPHHEKENDAMLDKMEHDDQTSDEENDSYQEAEDNDQEEDDSLGDADYLPEKKVLTDELAMRIKGNRHPPSWYQDHKSLADSLLLWLTSTLVLWCRKISFHIIESSYLS